MNSEKKQRRKTLLRSVLMAAALFVIGLGLVGWSSYALEIFTVVIGVYMVLSGILRVRDSISVKRAGKKGTPVNVQATLILAAIEIVFGVVCGLSSLILPERKLALAGVMLMLFGVTEIVNVIFLSVKRKKAETPFAPPTPAPAPAAEEFPGEE